MNTIILNVTNDNKNITMNWSGINMRHLFSIRCHSKAWEKLGELFGYRSRTAFIDYLLEAVLIPGNLYIIADFAKYILTEIETTEYGSPIYDCCNYTSTVNVDMTKLRTFVAELETYLKNYHNVEKNIDGGSAIGMIVCYLVNRHDKLEFVTKHP